MALEKLRQLCDGLRQVKGRLTGGGIDGDQLGGGLFYGLAKIEGQGFACAFGRRLPAPKH